MLLVTLPPLAWYSPWSVFKSLESPKSVIRTRPGLWTETKMDKLPMNVKPGVTKCISKTQCHWCSIEISTRTYSNCIYKNSQNSIYLDRKSVKSSSDLLSMVGCGHYPRQVSLCMPCSASSPSAFMDILGVRRWTSHQHRDRLAKVSNTWGISLFGSKVRVKRWVLRHFLRSNSDGDTLISGGS